MPTTYRVKQGDCICNIAFRFGFTEDFIWNHPENSSLKQVRKNPDALLHGDTVYIPDLRIEPVNILTDQKTRFLRKQVPARFKIQFNVDGEPYSHVQAHVKVDNIAIDPIFTDRDGKIEIPIKPDTTKILITFNPDSDKPEPHEFLLGRINPADTVSGQKARLSNLGFYTGKIDDEQDEHFKTALYGFQSTHNIEPSCHACDTTCSKLKEKYGS